MLHFSDRGKGEPHPEKDEGDNVNAPKVADILMMDRSDVRWAAILSALFSTGRMMCLFALAVLGIFFGTVVANQGEVRMIPILLGLGVTFVIGIILLEFAHVRALAGYRDARRRYALRSRALVAGAICIVLCMIHPLMGLAIPIGAGVGALGQLVLSRYARNEPLWDFLPTEAISILSGRDRIGATLATSRPRDHALAAVVTRSGSALSVVVALAIGAFLIAQSIMAIAAFVPLVLGTLWATEAILEYVHNHFSQEEVTLLPVSEVRAGPAPDEDDTQDQLGLKVHDLNVRNHKGVALLRGINLNIAPGTVTAVIGPSGAGKSLLLQSIVDPFSLANMEVSGFVRQSGQDLWKRQTSAQSVPAVFLPPHPVVLPATGAENLSCFHGDEMLTRGKWFLEQMVYAVDMVDGICAAQNAQTLPSMQIKALAMARAFTLGPQVYLMDRPEDGLPEKQIAALVHRIEQETRMGRCVVIVTDKRALLDVSDQMVVLQDGQVIDYGPSKEVRGRMETGWARFLGARRLVTEENLCNWIHSHFYRDGDEANRRKVAQVASDLLTFSCQTANPLTPGDVSFTFKHFRGFCILRMQDSDPPVSAGKLQQAQDEVSNDDGESKLSQLARIIRNSMSIEADMRGDERLLEVKIETYDPRKVPPPKAEAVHVSADT